MHVTAPSYQALSPEFLGPSEIGKMTQNLKQCEIIQGQNIKYFYWNHTFFQYVNS